MRQEPARKPWCAPRRLPRPRGRTGGDSGGGTESRGLTVVVRGADAARGEPVELVLAHPPAEDLAEVRGHAHAAALRGEAAPLEHAHAVPGLAQRARRGEPADSYRSSSALDVDVMEGEEMKGAWWGRRVGRMEGKSQSGQEDGGAGPIWPGETERTCTDHKEVEGEGSCALCGPAVDRTHHRAHPK